MKFSKKFSVKISKEIKIIYYSQQNFLVLIGPLGRKILKLEIKIFLTNNYICITKILNKFIWNNRKKNLKTICGTTITRIKQSLLEISVLINKKIQLIGIGYKVFTINSYKKDILELKLGFSHPIFYKIPKTLKTVVLKSTLLYIFGNSHHLIKQMASTIRLCKLPEIYKGKGILYENEKIILKEGKKV